MEELKVFEPMYRIGALTKILGCTPQTVYNMEKAGRIKRAPRDSNGQRRYTKDQIEKVMEVFFKNDSSTKS